MDLSELIENDKLIYQKPILEAMTTDSSDIAKFYENKTIFITGGSGFLGKQLVEKLFRCCKLKRAYILLRSKKGKNISERLKEMLNDSVFDEVRKVDNNFNEKIIGIEGDVGELDLGISPEDWETVSNEVEIVVNLAATVRFNDTIKNTTLINVRGTREAMKLAKSCKNIVCFIHVSTAYSQATSSIVGSEVFEQFYPSPVPPETMIEMVEEFPEEKLNEITPSLIGNWANTYTFTKAIAEELVRNESHNLKVAIVRPSIVLNTYREPIPAWLDQSCMYGPTGFVLGVILGIIRVMYVKNNSKLAFIPVDLVNNATIAAGWEVSTMETNGPIIYNASSTKAGVTFRHVSVPMRKKRVRSIVPSQAIWYCYLVETGNRTIFWTLNWLLHKIPAYIVDGVISVLKIKTPKQMKSLVKVYEKIDRLSDTFSFFLTNEWDFDDTNLKKLFNKMSEVDRKIFNFDVNSVDWDDYTLYWCLSIRKYIIKDDFKVHKTTARKQTILKIANFMVIVLYIYIFFQMVNFIYHLLF